MLETYSAIQNSITLHPSIPISIKNMNIILYIVNMKQGTE